MNASRSTKLRLGCDTEIMKKTADYTLLARSGLFDVNHYLLEAPDVVADGADPLEHFCRFGAREGRRPNLYFDPAWYAAVHLDGNGTGVNPLAHYVAAGERAGLRPIAWFDPAWYARTYALRRGTSPLAHYLAHRRSQRYAPNPLFDLAWYLARHGAEIGPNGTPSPISCATGRGATSIPRRPSMRRPTVPATACRRRRPRRASRTRKPATGTLLSQAGGHRRTIRQTAGSLVASSRALRSQAASQISRTWLARLGAEAPARPVPGSGERAGNSPASEKELSTPAPPTRDE